MIDGEDKLIRGAKRGKTENFSTLYAHYVPSIYRFIYMKVTHREEAEDLTHEVFLSAWQNLGSYQSRGFPFSSWLYQIARNKVIDYYRLRKVKVALEDASPEQLKAEGDPAAELDKQFTLETVRSAIRSLSHDKQDVLLMKFMEDLPHEEIARTLAKSEGAVRLIQHRAINELKKLLRQNE
jgi:RNA polymerase sigma-70 factor, ECF subfamily